MSYRGAAGSRPAAGVIDAIESADAVILAPSNPFVSIGPILAVPGIRQALVETRARVVAITPIIAGRALKGPTDRMLGELGHEVSAVSVARMYRDFVDLFVLDREDTALGPAIAELGIEVRAAATLMDSAPARARLAQNIVEMLG